jgi:hypothetical protein
MKPQRLWSSPGISSLAAESTCWLLQEALASQLSRLPQVLILGLGALHHCAPLPPLRVAYTHYTLCAAITVVNGGTIFDQHHEPMSPLLGPSGPEPRLIVIYEAEDRIPQLVETVKAAYAKCNAENPGLEADWKKQVRRSDHRSCSAAFGP